MTGVTIAALVLVTILFAQATGTAPAAGAAATDTVLPSATAPPTGTATPAATVTPALVSVAFEVVANSVDFFNPVVDIWYSSGVDQYDRERQRLRADEPYTIIVQVPPGTFLALFASRSGNGAGEITCRIRVAGALIQESTARGSGAGAYCAGVAHTAEGEASAERSSP